MRYFINNKIIQNSKNMKRSALCTPTRWWYFMTSKVKFVHLKIKFLLVMLNVGLVHCSIPEEKVKYNTKFSFCYIGNIINYTWFGCVLLCYNDKLVVGLVYGVECHFQWYFSYIVVVSYIVAVSFIGGGNKSIRRKPPTCCKTLTNFIT